MSKLVIAVVLLANLCLANCSLAADRIILRNLEIIRDRTVVSFDDDGVVLDAAMSDGSKIITWDRIERGTVAAEKQAGFNALLKEIGPPLFRIRQRLKTGDYRGLLEPADELFARYADRRSETAYMVCQSLMWARLSRGEREAAVEPYLRCFEMLRSRAAKITSIPGPRRFAVDAKTGFTPELTPVWFDPLAAKSALPQVRETVAALSTPSLAALVYAATLAQAAGENAMAGEYLARLPTDSKTAAEWRSVARGAAEISSGKPGNGLAELKVLRDSLSEISRPTAIYWLGLSAVQSTNVEEQQDGLLDLLSLAAIYGKQEPELAAAGLYQAMLALAKLKDDAGTAAIRRELLQNYAGTQHAAKLK